MSRRPHQGESSQRVATNPPSRAVRYNVPMMWPTGCIPEMNASMKSSVSRLRNTFGRISIRRFTDRAARSAAGRAPCVSILPTTDGIGMIRGSRFQVPL